VREALTGPSRARMMVTEIKGFWPSQSGHTEILIWRPKYAVKFRPDGKSFEIAVNDGNGRGRWSIRLPQPPRRTRSVNGKIFVLDLEKRAARAHRRKP